LYVCPTLSGLGITNKTIGSPRQIQMSLSLTFWSGSWSHPRQAGIFV